MPTFAEAGLPAFDIAGWTGLFAPAATPREIVDKMSNEMARILALPEIVERLNQQGLEPLISTPAEFERFVGQKIKVVLREPLENQKSWAGTLVSFAQGEVTLEPSPGRQLQFPFDQVQRANLKFEW